ncbi:MAG: DUF4981 domain-containing protein [Eubacterium sp.]|nr:DUF4981 domain-containing protein [Eubacterium sp.]
MSSFDFNKVKDPLFFKENVLPAHSDLKIYGCKAEANSKENSLRYCLNGIWKFAYAKNYDSVIKGFEQVEYDVCAWDDIRVPAHIQLEGYDSPQYANTQYPWDGHERINPGEIPEFFNPVASYVKHFELPDQMMGKEVRIVFQGVESGMALWLNGEYVGYSEDTFTPSEFDITKYVKDGINKLAVQVFKWTSSSWCEDQDFFRFSGIFRDVFIYMVPEVHVEDMLIKTLFEGNDFSKSTLSINMAVNGNGKVVARLYDGCEEVMNTSCEADGNLVIEQVIESPKLWSAEEPYLYRLDIEIYNSDNEIVEYIPQYVGFRKFEMKDNRMLLNGKRIVFKGVNRHEFSSISGRVVSFKELEKDIISMKRNNINAIRTCHYPDSEAVYDLCDKYGLYMIAECNIESHGSWMPYLEGKEPLEYVVPKDKDEWRPMLIDRMNSTYQRDKNHPAVLIWSVGNESFGGSVLRDVADYVRKKDPSRLVHYEGVFNDRSYNETSDMESRMYPKVTDIIEYIEGDDDRPFICCEYSHAMGNSCGAIHKYTELADKENSAYQGGFIWDYIDQSIYKKDRYGKWFQAYGGDFDERPTDFNFSGNGIAYGGERNESPKMQEVKFVYQNISVEVGSESFTVVNKNLFVNVDKFECVAELLRDGVLIDSKVISGVSVEACSSKTFDIPFEKPEFAGEYIVTISFRLKTDTIWAKAGYEIAFGQGVIAKTAKAEIKEKPYKVTKGDYNIGVKGESFEALFSFIAGGLVSYKYAGKEMLKAVPKPNFWRAPVDNDRGNNMPAKMGQWKLASLYSYTKDPVIKEEADYASITYTYTLPTTPEAECKLEYKVHGDGRIQVVMSYDPISGLGDMPEFGVMFKFDADYDNVEWYGNGPAETYEDRKHGGKIGIYSNKVEDNMAKYLVPQECGNKTEVRYAKLTDMKGRGIYFSGDNINFSALPYTPHEIENAMHDYELPAVHYTVVRVSKQQLGIGGDDSWGAPVHDEYHIDVSGPVVFGFEFRGV